MNKRRKVWTNKILKGKSTSSFSFSSQPGLASYPFVRHRHTYTHSGSQPPFSCPQAFPQMDAPILLSLPLEHYSWPWLAHLRPNRSTPCMSSSLSSWCKSRLHSHLSLSVLQVKDWYLAPKIYTFACTLQKVVGLLWLLDGSVCRTDQEGERQKRRGGHFIYQ